ncbi:hypothetical protein [Flavobacterium sp.]|uniref:hypothetical protein n=1 Tax=Flavobacterium sp. TaxID=239 RepID=UPI003752C8B0
MTLNKMKRLSLYKLLSFYNLFKIVLLGVNLLFVYKYSVRQNFIPAGLYMLVFILIFTPILFMNNFEIKFVDKFNLKKIYKIASVLIALVLFVIIYNIDGNKLNVDRWSAMDVGIEALLNGNYPYTATDHLNGRTSNFPGLLLIGIPFYLLGNVGYLQIFTFLLVCYTLYNYLEIIKAIRFMIVLLVSPAYWWEIFAISDLLSNVIIIFCFIIYVNQNFKNNIYKYPIILGVVSSILVLTRGIIWIPMILFLFRDFWFLKNLSKMKFFISFSITTLLLILSVIVSCPSYDLLKKYNPLLLQTSNLPKYIHIIAILLPFYFSFKINKFEVDFFKFTSILMFVPVLLAFILKFNRYNFNEIIVDLRFDLSYLTVIFPFMIIYIVDYNKINSLTK